MANKAIGANIYYFDTNGVVNNGLACNVAKIAIYGADSTAYIQWSGSNNLPAMQLNASPAQNWQETTLHPPHFFTTLSIIACTGSGFVWCV